MKKEINIDELIDKLGIKYLYSFVNETAKLAEVYLVDYYDVIKAIDKLRAEFSHVSRGELLLDAGFSVLYKKEKYELKKTKP